MDIDRCNKLATIVAKVWNELAKENGWPKRVTQEELRRMGPLITSVNKGLAHIGECTRNEETLIRWVLCRWNWERSPAPLTQVGVAKLWATLKDSIDRETEEAIMDIEKQLEEVAEWVRFQYERARGMGLTPADAADRVAKYAVSSGKVDTLTPREKARLDEELKKLTPP